MKKSLEPVTTKLKDIQRKLKALLPPNAVLVGHSLDLDLKALKVSLFVFLVYMPVSFISNRKPWAPLAPAHLFFPEA